MQVRLVAHAPRKRHHPVSPRSCSRSCAGLHRHRRDDGSRSSVPHLFHVNESIYDPSMFAIGISGLFCMLCGVMLMVMARNSRPAPGTASRENPLRGAGRQHLGD
jgi:hypothetical protein